MSNPERPPLPIPKRRLFRTLFRRPRDLRQFVQPLSFDEVGQNPPTDDEAAHWGEVILLEDHVSVLHRDGTLTYGVHYISKLHGDMNLAMWEQALWYYEPKMWRPTVHHAVLRTPEGWTQTATIADRHADPSKRVRFMHIAFGPLRRGVIADFSYQMDHFRPQPIGPCAWGEFYLQTASPCRRRRYTVAVAAPFTAQVKTHHGALPPHQSTVEDYTVYRWDRFDVPGIEWDAWTPPLRDFGPWVDFSTLPSWDAVADQYRKDMAPTDSHEVRSLAARLTSSARTPADKLRAIYRYAAEQVRYGRPPNEVYLPASRPVSQMFMDLRGDCKDKSTLMVSMLRSVGIRAEIATVLTRSKGLTPYLPAPRFDHALVVAELDGKLIWLDAAAGPVTVGSLPYQDQGIRALIVAAESNDYVEAPAPQPEDHSVSWTSAGRLDERGEYAYAMKFTASGERASMVRFAMQHRSAAYQTRLLKQTLVRGVPGAEVSDLRINGLDDLALPFACECRVQVPHCARPVDDHLVLQPPWVEPAIFDGPLAASDRPQPLASPLVQATLERHEIALPEGYVVQGVPAVHRESCPTASYENTSRVEDGRLICERRLLFLGGIVTTAQYPELKKFWAACARSDATPLLLAKSVL